MTRKKMLDVRAQADNRDQPGNPEALIFRQRIIEYREWQMEGPYSPGQWRATVVLADGARIEIAEKGRF
jgi:hypothetical protein